MRLIALLFVLITIAPMLFESDFYNNPPQLSLSFSITPHYPNSRDNADDFIASFKDFFSDGADVMETEGRLFSGGLQVIQFYRDFTGREAGRIEE